MPDKLYDDTYLQQLQTILAKTVQRSLELLNAQHGDNIADIGCGTGILATSIATSNATVYGIDNDSNFLAIAQQQNNTENPVNFIKADADKIPLPNACLDKIICHRVLQHIPNHDSIVKEFKRLLKPNGTIHLVEPDYLSYSFFLSNIIFERKLIDSVAFNRIPNSHTIRQLPNVLKQNGFDVNVVEVHNYLIDSFELANYIIRFDYVVEQGFANKIFTEQEYQQWQQLKHLPKGQFNMSFNLLLINATNLV